MISIDDLALFWAGVYQLASYQAQARTQAAEESMKCTWTIIGVANVPQSFKW
jgi:hypothetical protein